MRTGAAPRLRAGAAAILAIASALVLLACGKSPDSGPSRDSEADDPTRFRILAGSELKELGPAIEETARSDGVRVKLTYAGTLEMVDRVNAGQPFDALLPANGAYPSLALTTKPLAKEKLFYSRVALGVKTSKARELGWLQRAPTWAEIAAAVKDGKFVYAMTNPTSSNTGMSALFAVASSVAGKTEDLSVEEVDRQVLKDFLKGQKLTAGSSGWLADAYLREQDHLDGIVNYEAVLLRLNDRAEVREKLTIIYPHDGVISADYPLMLVNGAKRAEYDRLVAALKSKEFQSGSLAHEFLRPSNPDATRAPQLPDLEVAELAFPNRLQVIDAVLISYQDELRRPATSIYVLDVSGSMRGERLQALKSALMVLSGANTSTITARFARFQNRERVVMLPFSSDPGTANNYSFEDPATRDSTSEAIRNFVQGLEADGGTAIYATLAQAYELARQERARNPDRLVTIVLLTDGENTEDPTYKRFRPQLSGIIAQDGTPIRTFPILFGEGSVPELEDLARLTGGRAFDGRRADLSRVFQEVRGYQ